MKYFCILLKSDKKRLNHVISNVLKEMPYLDIFPAIDGKTNELEHYLEDRKIDKNFLNFCRRGQLACLLSHLRVWEKIVKEDITEAIILEDDVKIENNLSDINIPKDAEFAYLYIHPDSVKKDKDDKGYTSFQKGYKTFGTVAYYITKKLAEEFIVFFKDKITTTIDDSISWYLEKNNKKYYCANLVDTIGNLYFHKKGGIGSVIGETDLYKNNSGISSFYIDKGDYLLYPCCNCEDNNLYFRLLNFISKNLRQNTNKIKPNIS